MTISPLRNEELVATLGKCVSF